MAFYCFKCGKEILLTADGRVGRKESCPSCSSDVHVCKNCKFYDLTAYNQCKESSAERVLEKDRSNFCDYFAFAPDRKAGSTGTGQSDALKKLDDLFKK